MDLGECMKVHDLALRADYEIASKEHEYFFELDVSYSYTPWLFVRVEFSRTFLRIQIKTYFL